MRFMLAIGLILFLSQHSPLFGQVESDQSKIARMQETIDTLEKKLRAVEQERDALRKQLDDLEKQAAKESKENAGDAFAVGSEWKGSRFYSHDALTAQEWRLVVTERDKKKFKGEIHFQTIDNLQQALPISGIAPPTPSGTISFRTEQKDVLEQVFKGTVKGGQISIKFEGTGVNGLPVQGTGNLKRSH